MTYKLVDCLTWADRCPQTGQSADRNVQCAGAVVQFKTVSNTFHSRCTEWWRLLNPYYKFLLWISNRQNLVQSYTWAIKTTRSVLLGKMPISSFKYVRLQHHFKLFLLIFMKFGIVKLHWISQNQSDCGLVWFISYTTWQSKWLLVCSRIFWRH
jgi:hypothetical protein